MTNGIASETNGITSEVALLPCPLCGKKVRIARSDNEQGERWWFVTRGTCKTTRCNCRLFLESEKFTCGWNDAHALECRRKLIERWNARADVAEMAQRIQSLESECAKLQDELRKAGNRGGLTADQVRERVERVYLEGYSDGSANRGAHIEETDWQAIADELNAALGGECETCELEPLPAIVVTMNMLNEIGWCKCSKCGFATPDESNYCQNCGKAVKR